MEINWNTVAGDLITQVLRIILPVLIALVLKWAGELWLRFKETRPDWAYAISKGAEIGYFAAEEYFHNHPEEDGKMEYAIEEAHRYIKEAFGVDIDLQTIADAIANFGVSYKQFSWAKDGDDGAGDTGE